MNSGFYTLPTEDVTFKMKWDVYYFSNVGGARLGLVTKSKSVVMTVRVVGGALQYGRSAQLDAMVHELVSGETFSQKMCLICTT